MATSLRTRVVDGPGVESVKESPLTSIEVDTNFITLAENKLERENNLSDLIDAGSARTSLNVPSREGGGAFGTWNISIEGNSATSVKLQNARNINSVAFDGSTDITITAASPNELIFGTGLTSSGNYDGSAERIVQIDTNDVVSTSGAQSIDGTKTFTNTVELATQATTTDHAVRADRTINTGNGITGGSDLTSDITLEIDVNAIVDTTTNQTIDGTKTFLNSVVLEAQATSTNEAVRADRSVDSGDGLTGGGNLTSDRELSVDSTVIRTVSDQTLDGIKTFTNPPILTTSSTSPNEAVRSDRNIDAGDGLTGGGNLTSDITFEVNNTVIRTTGNQTLGGNKTFTNAVVLESQGSALDEAINGSRDLSAGDGLVGGGNLTSDLSFSVDSSVIRDSGSQTIGGSKTFSDPIVLTSPTTNTNEAVRADRNINAGDGLTGGGNLTNDVTVNVDTTVIRTTGDQTLSGIKTFLDPISLDTQATALDHAVRADRNINAGDGLDGGGNLTSNPSFSVDNTVVRTTREVIAGDGLTGGGDLSTDPTVSVDNTVIRTTGDQTLSGTKTFTNAVELTTQATTLSQAVRADREVTAGDGLTGGGDLSTDPEFSVDGTVVRTSGNFTISGRLSLDQEGIFAQNPVRADRQIITGDGLTGGDDLTTDVNLSVDNTVVRTNRQIITGDGLTGGDDLTTDVTLSVDDNIARGRVQIALREKLLLETEIDSAFEQFLVGEVVQGLSSGARAEIQETIESSDSYEMQVLLISGSFNIGEILEGETSGAQVDLLDQTILYDSGAQDIRVTGEVLDFLPTDVNNVENVTDIPNALDKVLSIGGKLFEWTDEHLNRRFNTSTIDSDGDYDDNYFIQKSDFGVVAQDVQEVFPEGVREKENGELVVDYRKLFALSFAAIKELNDKIGT